MRGKDVSKLLWRPWAGAYAERRFGLAALIIFMQISLVFWPVAVRLARRVELAREKQRLLDILAEVHAPPRPERKLKTADRSLAQAS
jgi:hypothetical protein